ncbi:alpha-glucosidase [Varunaivibrio sulfuroxidans]|uniref:Alpha-glucosidase n=1 Tax=Varunaivibrio sulfuroxidans TaxID=1773489 RepID=A0A4R3J9G8_9PROT|nr:alpha-glucosidase [Varunaivibrio sulfuroxidans]TCS62222.1 alpha-glucosidase [Varunaivibrio sulfuroxidans]WES30647.1 alpha glucosidase [Varunaivibrio sulfuroxidans]
MTDKAGTDAQTLGLKNDPDWWRGAVIYQIYPRSFQDTNADGVGDLKGIARRMDYIAELGADAIWISPFFRSPMKDFGYDVSDYNAVDPLFGALEDFDEMIAAAHARGVRVMIDLVISHTSDQHAWFKESRADRTNPKAEWYVWADAKPEGSPPNNWLSIFGGSAWEWDTARRQYYLHNFLISQPDLNFHNPEVQDAVLDAARFWLDRGVDGFRLDTVNFYFHDRQLRDNPPLPKGKSLTGVEDNNPYAFQDHVHDKTQPENLAFLERLRGLMDEYSSISSVGEIGADTDPPATTAAYTEDGKRIHMAYSFDLLTEEYSAAHIRDVVETFERSVGGGWPCWAFSNHDIRRVVTRWNKGKDPDRFAPMALALLLSLRGSACVYQGEELGLSEADVPFELLQDPFGKRFWPAYKGRDGCRTPMPWREGGLAAGFSDAAPWLPVPPEHAARAVGVQETDDGSVLAHARRFIAWRRGHDALRRGGIVFHDRPEPILAFSRTGTAPILCLFNLSSAAQKVDVSDFDGLSALDGHGFAASGGGARGSIALGGYGVWYGVYNKKD